jgi:hypothetical protein
LGFLMLRRGALQNVFAALALVHICPAALGFSVLSGVRLPARAAAAAQVLPARCNNVHGVSMEAGVSE